MMQVWPDPQLTEQALDPHEKVCVDPLSAPESLPASLVPPELEPEPELENTDAE
jgi:hypothetical protein